VDGELNPKEKGREESSLTLQQRCPIRYRSLSRVPVQMLVNGNKLRIRFFVKYSKNMFEIFPGTNLTYADIAEEGIRENWSGRYYFPWLADDGYERAHARASVRVLDNKEDPSETETVPLEPSVRTTVEFVRYDSKAAADYPGQRYYQARLSCGTVFPAHVISPVWRWYWGFFRSFQLESLHLNWSRKYPGKVTFQKEPDRSAYRQICAHETGHLLGLGDAYGANYRFFYEAPGTGAYMMCHNRKVQPAEMEMIFNAHMTNHMQYFPKKFTAKVYFAGIKREYQLQFNLLSKNSKTRH